MSPRDPYALRASLDARLQLVASERGQDVNRLRRHLVFQRILRRLGDGWILKGGYLLEARLGARARATKDLDLATSGAVEDLAASLARELRNDVDLDGFVFRVAPARTHLADAERLGGQGASVPVTAMLAGREFASVRVDVVARPSEISGGTERVTLPAVVSEPEWPPVALEAVDLAQHLAEKFHALTQMYTHPRPSTRVKDLLDVVLVLESFEMEPARLAERLAAVFATRDGAPPPPAIPDPPAAWSSDFAVMVSGHDVLADTLDEALRVTRSLYSQILTHLPSTQEPS